MDKQLLPLLYLGCNFLPVPLITTTVVIDVVAGHGSVITYDSLTWMWLLIPMLVWLICVASVLQRTKRSQIFNVIDFWKVPYLVQSQPLPVHIQKKFHYCDVIMGAVTSQITSLTIVYSTVYSDADQGNIKAPRHWLLCGGIPRTNSQ